MNEQLSDDDLKAWLTDVPPPVRSALLELQQLRAAQSAGAERVRGVVSEAVVSMVAGEFGTTTAAITVADAIADRVASQLFAPCDVEPFISMACEQGAKGCTTQHASATDAARLESAARRAIEANGPGETTVTAVVHEIADIMVERWLAEGPSTEALSLVSAYRDELAGQGINGLSIERAQFISAQIARCNAVIGAPK